MSHVLWYPGHEVLLPNIVRAENCSLYDAQGNRYVDLGSGVWCTALGHGHPRVRAVLAEQAARISHTGFCYSTRVVEEAAHTILSLLGFPDGQCIFLSSGSEAVEYSVRVAQAVANRPLLMTMSDTYSGAYGSANRKQSDEWWCFDWMACGAGDKHDAAWGNIPFEHIGGVLFEPGSSAGLVRFPPDTLVRSIVARIQHQDGLVLANEVTTGIGRTGTWFGYQHYDLTPDMVVLGKGIGNGYPVSVVAVAPRVCERLAHQPVRYAQSHQNDPLGAAVAQTVITVIQEEGLIARGQDVATRLLTGLHGIQERTGKLQEIRARGLMLALVLRDDPAGAFTRSIHTELVRRGYVVGLRPGVNVLRLDPSLTIDHEDVVGFLETFEAVLDHKT